MISLVWNEGFDAMRLRDGLFQALGALGRRNKVLVIPPDFTRYHSRAGELTQYAFEYYGERLACVLPALGTHAPMTEDQIATMFGNIPRELFHVHDWQNGLVTLGEMPAEFLREQSESELNCSWPVRINRLVVEGGFDLILSIGQVVPHEVAGMAGHNKNILIGTGGPENIHLSHYLGALYGMERIMGRADNPVRRVLNRAAACFLSKLPIVHVLTVIGNDTGGLFIGDGLDCFEKASTLSLRVNFTMLEQPIRKAVVHLDESEYRSTWLGNKSIYRTRMALAGGGELIVLAPGVRQFGENALLDSLIRRFGYCGTRAVRQAVERHPELAANLSAAAHLIHGSSEGRFTITYCSGHLRKEEIEAVGFRYAPLDRMLERYSPSRLRDGYNDAEGEEIFFISNPALGLWAHRDRFLQPLLDNACIITSDIPLTT